MSTNFFFQIVVVFSYEPTRTEVTNLSRRIARAAGVSVVSRLSYNDYNFEHDGSDLWDVTFSFTTNRIDAAKAFNAFNYDATLIAQDVNKSVSLTEVASRYSRDYERPATTRYEPWPAHLAPSNLKVAS